MDIITGHVNTDMDSLAATLLAGKLYPEALMVFPGSLNKNVRNFVSLHKDVLPVRRYSNIMPSEVKRLIVVDTRNPGRLGPVQELMQVEGVEIIIFDHHDSQSTDICGHEEHIEAVGSTTTLVMEQILRKGLSLTPFEATVAAMGIYEDTGRFTFAGTTIRDAQMLPVLLAAGAQLQMVGEFIDWSVSEEQRSLLADLLTNAEIIERNGLRFVVARAVRKEYIADLASITHHIGELYDVDAAATVVAMGTHIYFVGRSYSAEIDVCRAAQALGGGGHARAASAMLKNADMEKVYHSVVHLLTNAEDVQQTARDVMTSPVKTIDPAMTMREVGNVLVRCGHSGIPVVENGAIVGIVSRRDIEKAQLKNLEHAPVKGFMQKHVISVMPDTSIRDVQRLMIEHDIGRLPVVEKDAMIGIITRSDILRVLHGAELHNANRVLYGSTDPTSLPSTQQVDELLRRQENVYRLLVETGELAERLGMRAAVVGGFVRDLFLGVGNEDLDIVIEGDGVAFAVELSRKLEAELKIHAFFGTAMLILSDGKKIDIATARTEYYEFPAALPTVTYSSLRQDLGRRDFTINAMAVDITPANFAQVLDFFGGYADLKQGLIRILYTRSFNDDPTRIFRSIRFEQRYGFKLENQTEQLLNSAVARESWQNLSADRLAREFILIFKENRCRRIIRRLDNLGLWPAIFPAAVLDQTVWEGLRRAQQVRYILANFITADSPWLIVPLLLFYRLSAGERAAYIDLLRLTARQRANMENTLEVLPGILDRLQQRQLSGAEIYDLLQPLSGEAVILITTILCRHKQANRRILAFFRELRGIKPLLNGEDIRQLGLRPGPAIGEVLRLLQRQKLNGGLSTKEEEKQFVKDFIAKRKELPSGV